MAEGAAALGVGLAFRDAFPVEVRHLLNQVVVLEQDRAVGPDRERVFVAGNRDSGVRCRRPHVVAAIVIPLWSWVLVMNVCPLLWRVDRDTFARQGADELENL